MAECGSLLSVIDKDCQDMGTYNKTKFPKAKFMDLPNLWHVCGFRSRPYFQDELQEGSTTNPLTLFVGRETEKRLLLATIGSGANSRQAVAGFSGVGKTTLVHAVKAEARKANYCVADNYISITPQHSSDVLLGQIICGIYYAILVSKPELESQQAMKDTRPLVEIIQQQNIAINVQLLGTGVGGSYSKTIFNPSGGLVLSAPNIIENLVKCALEKSNGVLLHLNNLENLSESDTIRAADLLRSVRDTGLMKEGLHLIVVGPTSAIRTVINRHPQIRSVFSYTINLKELALPDVHKLLENRYKMLQSDPNIPFQKPVDDDVVNYLYKFFRGDLRAMLRSLENIVQRVLLENRTNTNALPLSLNSFLALMRELTQDELEALEESVSPANWNRIVIWANKDPDSTQTQESLLELWGITNVSDILKDLAAAGAVDVLPSRARHKIQYLLTANAKLAASPDRDEAE